MDKSTFYEKAENKQENKKIFVMCFHFDPSCVCFDSLWFEDSEKQNA